MSTTSRAEADGLEDLGAAVARHVRDAHLRHDLEDAVLDRVPEAALGLGRRGPVAAELVGGRHARDGLERQPRADRVGAVAEQASRSGGSRAARRSRRRPTRACAGPLRRGGGGRRRSRAAPGSAPAPAPAAWSVTSRSSAPPSIAACASSPRRAHAASSPSSSSNVASSGVRRSPASAVGKRKKDSSSTTCAASGLGQERLARAEQRAQRHDAPLAQVVDRRVRDLREALLEDSRRAAGPGPRAAAARCRRPSTTSARARARRSAAGSSDQLLARVAVATCARQELGLGRLDRLAGPRPPRRPARTHAPVRDARTASTRLIVPFVLETAVAGVDGDHLARARAARGGRARPRAAESRPPRSEQTTRPSSTTA